MLPAVCNTIYQQLYIQTNLKCSLKMTVYEPKHAAINTIYAANKLRFVYRNIIV